MAGQYIAPFRDAMPTHCHEGNAVNRIVYIVGAVVIILAVLSYFGMR